MQLSSTGEKIYKLFIYIIFLTIIGFIIYYYIAINELKSEINKLDYDKIYTDKSLYEYIKTNNKEIQDKNNHLINTDLNIDKLNSVINTFIDTSIKKSDINDSSVNPVSVNIASLNPTSIKEINDSLQSYIYSNDDKLDNYILSNDAKLEDLIEAKSLLMYSIININSRLNSNI